ncbi:hypothetical protein CLU95_1407 [Variovorax sp. 54]|uniref:hypothetical protein n=1 Tax=Variovorax sp. 54 TaxID=2035212 RepID=UPI000C193C4D|nr:hypothetical protein [Variovorax sp. 54]PIF74283.1 hypothetical protein CLU95_1407 [Variovorax sp. 54]
MQHTPATPSLRLPRHARAVHARVLAGAALLLLQPVLLFPGFDRSWLDLFEWRPDASLPPSP